MILSDVQTLLSKFRWVFTRQKTFVMFVGVMLGFLCCQTNKYVTRLSMSARSLGGTKVSRYWSFCKFFSRRRWAVIDLMRSFLAVLLVEFSDYRVIIDGTSTTTQGRRQQWRHYRPNSHYRRGAQNQSKFLAGNSALSVAFVGLKQTASGEQSWTFPLGAVLLNPGNRKHQERPTAVRTIRQLKLPKGTRIIADRLYSDAHTLNSLRRMGHVLISRMQGNAAFYQDAACRKKLLWDTVAEEVVNHEGHTTRRAVQVCYRKKLKKPIVVVRERFYDRRRKKWRSIYYCSTDTQMSASEIIVEYRRRTQIEHAHQDSKLLAGFNDCRLHSAKSIEGFLSLSLLSVGLLEYVRYQAATASSQAERQELTATEVADVLDMHWYKPAHLTRGLMQRYTAQQLDTARNPADFLPYKNSALSLIRSFFST